MPQNAKTTRKTKQTSKRTDRTKKPKKTQKTQKTQKLQKTQKTQKTTTKTKFYQATPLYRKRALTLLQQIIPNPLVSSYTEYLLFKHVPVQYEHASSQ